MTRETSDDAVNDQNDNRRHDDVSDDATDDATDDTRNANHVASSGGGRCHGYRYSGQFTEKLFRSKSQPMLRMKAFARLAEEPPADVEDGLPFADICDGDQHFSPIRGARKAPIIEFKDI